MGTFVVIPILIVGLGTYYRFVLPILGIQAVASDADPILNKKVERGLEINFYLAGAYLMGFMFSGYFELLILDVLAVATIAWMSLIRGHVLTGPD